VTPYRKALNALGVGGSTGLTLEADGQYEVVYLTAAYTANTTDAGHAFESDLTGIVHRQAIPATSWEGRVFGATGFTITDPGGGAVVTQIVVVKQGNGQGGVGGGGTPGTSRLIAHQTLATPVTWDGVADQQNFNASGIFRLGAA
jgi:hypothetical protein